MERMIKSEIKWTTSIRGNVILHDGGRASPLILKKAPLSIKFAHAHYHHTGPLNFRRLLFHCYLYFCCTYRHFLEREYVIVSFFVVLVVVVFLFYPG